ncbi:MAG: TonB-dependent receptor [Rubrivivax sp.]
MFKRTELSRAVVVLVYGLGLVGGAALAQERIEITGSAIKRTDAETALPVTVIRAADLERLGVTNAEQALARIASVQSNFGASASIGGTTGGKAEADLRGLSGPTGTNANKTLVLLNGRRMANHSFDAAAVDLNAIPMAAVDRVEVLRDGASAIYGTDAIGGVINFILKRDFRGVELSASQSRPEAGNAGSTTRANVVAGFGSLSENRFNVMGAIDWRKQKVLEAVDRKFGSTGVLGTRRADITAGTSGTAFPGDVDGFEPSGPACDPPFSIPRNTNADNTGAFQTCRYDFTKSIDLVPETEQITGLLRGTFSLTSAFTLTAEYVYANNKATSRVAPAPTTHLILATSPFFPAGAPTRDLDALIPFFGVTDPVPGGPTLGGAVNWRQVPAGKRTSGDDTTTDRFMLDLEGTVGALDLRGAVGRTTNKSEASVKRGYVNDQLMQDGVWAGVINPFGTHTAANFGQTAAGLAAIEAAQVVAPTLIGKATVDVADARVSTDLFKLPAGSVVGAFGIDLRREKSSFEATDITAQLGSLGIDPNSDTSGSRNVGAIYAELGIPLMKGLDATVAARFDRYSDVGSTFNPKVAIKFAPMAGLALRASANKGFRAPTLYEIHQPQSLTFTTDNYDDPVLCPGGTPVAGTSAGVVCGQQVLQRNLGPVANGLAADTLKPEKSTAFSAGLVFEPMRGLSFTVDYFQMEIKNLISGLPEQEIFASSTRYASRFVRCSTVAAGGTPGITLGMIDACGNLSPTQDPIAFIDTPTENLGTLKVNGIDVSASRRSGGTPAGNFGVAIEGTYLTKYNYQRERGGTFINALGRYSDNAPVFRWQHVVGIDWNMGPFGATLGQRFKSGYVDQDGTSSVGSYEIYDLSLSYTPIKSLTLTLAVNNLLDKDPPRSVQVTTFQRGYDPRFTDPLGRTYTLRAGLKF